MLPKYARVKGFTSYIDEYIPFEDFGNIFAVLGENGAGKSSLTDIITTALFYQARGTDARGAGMDDLINKYCEFFEIEFVFTMNGREYKIIRKKTKGGAHELSFFVDGVNQSEKITETQEKINNVLKAGYDTFMDSVCIGQGESGRFMKKNPNERKDIFVEILNLNKYEVLEKYTKDLRKDTKEKIEQLGETLEDLEQTVSEKFSCVDNICKSQLAISEIKEKITNKESQLAEELKDKAQYEQIKKQRDLILSQRSTLKRKIDNITSALEYDRQSLEDLTEKVKQKDQIKQSYDDTNNTIKELQDSYQTKSNEKSSLDTTHSFLMKQAKDLKTKYDQLKNYNEAKCNICGHDITEDYKETYLKDLMTEGKKFMVDANAIKTQVQDLETELSTLSSNLRTAKTSLSTYQTQYNTIIKAEAQLGALENTIKTNEEDLIEYKENYRQNLEIQLDDLEARSFDDDSIKIEIANLRKQLTGYESQLTLSNKKLEDINEAESEIDSVKQEIDELKVKFEDYDSLVTAYGKSGIQADIIANALPEIETEINDLLKVLSKNVSIQFKTQKDEKKKSKAKNAASMETLDIIINDETQSRKYETYSGGEKFRVDFACHVGLGKFLAKRAGATFDFFVLDEGLGSQDENARNQFIYCVQQLSKVFKQIMVITHIDEMKEAFDNRVLVYKDPIEGSKVKVI